MAVSASHSVLIGLISLLTNKDLDPEKFALSNPTVINTQYNTRIKISPTLDTPFYFGSWFNYNRVNLSVFNDISIPLNGATRFSHLLSKMCEVVDFSVVISYLNTTMQATLSPDDIIDYDLPPLLPGDVRAFVLKASNNSYLFTGQTTIFITA